MNPRYARIPIARFNGSIIAVTSCPRPDSFGRQLSCTHRSIAVGKLNDAIVTLRIEKIHQRCASVLIGKGDCVAHVNRLVEILRLVWLDQSNIAAHQFVGIVDVAENLRFGRFGSLLASVDVYQCAFFLALVLVEDPQRDADAEAESLVGIRVIGRGIVGVPGTECWIGGPIGDGEFVIGLGLLDCLDRGSQVWPVVESNLVIIGQGLQRCTQIKCAGYVELIDGCAVVEQQQELNLLCAQIDDVQFQFQTRIARAEVRSGPGRSWQGRRL